MRVFHPARFVGASIALLVPLVGSAQQPDTTASKPGGSTTTLPLPYTRSVKFSTDEGTWMSLDVSPDGKTIVFDLAGDLYTMPITGGKATRITDGPGFDAQPRFRPDGKKIVFQSDRSGSENLYTVDPDGKNVEAYTTGDNLEYLSPVYAPDGSFLVVTRAQYNNLGNYDMYVYRGEKTAGLKLNNNGQNAGGFSGGDALGAAFGSDPRYLYVSIGSSWGYNKQSFPASIIRYDFQDGGSKTVASASGGAFRPIVSHDGKWLVYATRRDTSTSLRIKNLETENETWLIDNVQRDDQESRHTRDLMPGSAFTPDNKAIITAYNGKFWRVEVPSGRATMIPFTADVDVQLGDRVRFDYPISDSLFTVSQIQDPRLSPDNKRVVFTAVNRVFVMDLPNGTPRQLSSGDPAFGPIWSPDGKWVAYTTWDEAHGAVYRVVSDGSGTAEKLTAEDAQYRNLAFNPSGSRLLLSVSSKKNGSMFGWMPSSGGALTKISDAAYGTPYFVKGDSTRIYFGTSSIRWDGYDRKTHLRASVTSFSPDGERVLTRKGDDLAIARVPFARDLETDLLNQGSPVLGRGLNALEPEYVSWSPDGSKVTWAAGRFLFIYDVVKSDSILADSISRAKAPATPDTAKKDSAAKADSAPKGDAGKPKPLYEAQRIDVNLILPKDRPIGTLVLQNARVITMRGDEVLEQGDIVITNNRITAVGRSGEVAIPAGATVKDLRGRTIMPGMVDVHAHPHVQGLQPWTYVAGLAYGITTSRDPQTGGTAVLRYQDLVETGDIMGPRVFSTGPGLFGPAMGSPDNNTLEKAREALRPYADLWFTHTLKQYMSGGRKTRQYILMAAKEYRISPTLEGGLDFKKNLTEAIDGFAGSEHAYPITPLYKDMVEILAKSGVTYTPTLMVAYGGPWSENFMYQKFHGLHDDARLRRFVPHSVIDGHFLRSPNWFADNLYVHTRLAAQAAKIVNAGGHVGLGGHGQFTGIGDHFELWMLQSGGMRPIDALRCATLFGAEGIGLDKEIGSIEPGKLADLIVLEKNPLDDIHNSTTIRFVMKNGRLYDGDNLDEVWPRQITRKPFWWMADETVIPLDLPDEDLEPIWKR